MTTQAYYVLAFALTAIVAVFMFVLATVVFLRGKREYLNITCALLFIFAGLFVASGLSGLGWRISTNTMQVSDWDYIRLAW
jgi:hypothetical protein